MERINIANEEKQRQLLTAISTFQEKQKSLDEKSNKLQNKKDSIQNEIFSLKMSLIQQQQLLLQSIRNYEVVSQQTNLYMERKHAEINKLSSANYPRLIQTLNETLEIRKTEWKSISERLQNEKAITKTNNQINTPPIATDSYSIDIDQIPREINNNSIGNFPSHKPSNNTTVENLEIEQETSNSFPANQNPSISTFRPPSILSDTFRSTQPWFREYKRRKINPLIDSNIVRFTSGLQMIEYAEGDQSA